MLVLSRKPGESVRTSNGLVVQVLRIEAGRVKLGFTAPEDVVILRDEIRPKKRSPAESPSPAALEK